MKNIYYRIYFGVLVSGFNYPIDYTLDTLLRKSMKSGIKDVSGDSYFIYLTFNDGVKAKLWNVNRYYAWACKGFIGEYSFEDGRPTVEIMHKLIQLLKTI